MVSWIHQYWQKSKQLNLLVSSCVWPRSWTREEIEPKRSSERVLYGVLLVGRFIGVEFLYYQMMNDIQTFNHIWAIGGMLLSVREGAELFVIFSALYQMPVGFVHPFHLKFLELVHILWRTKPTRLSAQFELNSFQCGVSYVVLFSSSPIHTLGIVVVFTDGGVILYLLNLIWSEKMVGKNKLL